MRIKDTKMTDTDEIELILNLSKEDVLNLRTIAHQRVAVVDEIMSKIDSVLRIYENKE